MGADYDRRAATGDRRQADRSQGSEEKGSHQQGTGMDSISAATVGSFSLRPSFLRCNDPGDARLTREREKWIQTGDEKQRENEERDNEEARDSCLY